MKPSDKILLDKTPEICQISDSDVVDAFQLDGLPIPARIDNGQSVKRLFYQLERSLVPGLN